MYSRMLGIHGTIGAIVAIALMGVSALVLDRGHLISAPAGVIEVGELAPVEVLTLDEVIVRGKPLA